MKAHVDGDDYTYDPPKQQTFLDLMEVQEVIRIWYCEHPGKPLPKWLKEHLRKAHIAHYGNAEIETN